MKFKFKEEHTAGTFYSLYFNIDCLKPYLCRIKHPDFGYFCFSFVLLLLLVVFIRDEDFNSDLYGLPAIIYGTGSSLTLFCLSRKSAVVGSFKFEVLFSIQSNKCVLK